MDTIAEPSAQERLLDTLQQGGDFPALSRTIAEINHAVGDESSRANVLTDIILHDVSLTNKLLRLVNAAAYGSFGSHPVSTISRAIVILGFDAVRDAAVSLLLFEHLKSHAQADELKAEAIEAFFCGVLGRLLANRLNLRDSEEAFICALFHNLGRLMMRFHFYEGTQHIRQRVEQEGIGEEAATRQEFGLGYDEIGVAIARLWGLPHNILHAMTPLPAGPAHAGHGRDDKLRLISNLARELHREIAANLPAVQEEERMAAIAKRFEAALPLSLEELQLSVDQAAEHVMEEAASLQVDVFKSPLIKRLLRAEQLEARTGTDAAADADADALAGTALPKPDAPASSTGLLAQGIQDLTSLLLGPYQIADVIKMVAELYFRSGAFDRVVIAAYDRGSHALIGRIAHGTEGERLKAAMRIPLAFTADVFHAAISRGQDILISDATAANIRPRIPDWYRHAAPAHAFLLLPLMVQEKPLALIYGDRANAELNLPADVLGLLKALRNQAILAIQQKI